MVKNHDVDPEIAIPMDKLNWMQEELVKTGNLQKAGDLNKIIDPTLRRRRWSWSGNSDGDAGTPSDASGRASNSSEWQDTCATLHLWTQVVGKIRLTLAPMLNHWWQVTLYVTARGLTTSAMPYRRRHSADRFRFLRPPAGAAHERWRVEQCRARAAAGGRLLRRA